MVNKINSKIKILVTGASGQLGHCLVEQLSNIDNITLKAYDREALDITNQQAVSDAISSFKPDFIVNGAAHTAVDKAESEPERAYAINEQGPSNLAKSAQAVNATLIHVSTDYVFDGTKQSPYCEIDIPNPQGIYGKSKLAGELAVAKYCTKYIILRTAWVFGENGNNFVKTMLKLGSTRSELGIIGDQFGGPTYAGDIAAAIIIITKHIEVNSVCPSGVYHYSGTPHVSWYQFATKIFENAKVNNTLSSVPIVNKIKAVEYPLPAPRPSNSRLNCELIDSIFSIKPSDWRQALTNIKAYN
jgi:dTDP-4-dehydrorhamnose reductase